MDHDKELLLYYDIEINTLVYNADDNTRWILY